MLKRKELSASELTTMKCIWDTGATTAKCIAERLGHVYGMKYDEPTVLKFLEKLLQIGFIDACGEMERYYIPVKEEKDFQREQQRKVLKFWVSRLNKRFASGL